MDASNEVLDGTPERATRFLTGLGAVASIRTLLFQGGMTDADIAEGRQLLLACLAAPADSSAIVDTEGARAQRAAMAELDEWDEPNFARVGAALRRRFPAVAEWLFQDLAASTGATAVKGVAAFLQRLNALDKGTDPARKAPATRADDQKAVALLATRGLDTTERARLQRLVDVALGPTAPLPSTTLSASARHDALVALRGWYEEWATTARTVVKKRSYLIRLGLAARKPSPKKEPTDAKTSAATPVNGAKVPVLAPEAEPTGP